MSKKKTGLGKVNSKKNVYLFVALLVLAGIIFVLKSDSIGVTGEVIRDSSGSSIPTNRPLTLQELSEGVRIQGRSTNVFRWTNELNENVPVEEALASILDDVVWIRGRSGEDNRDWFFGPARRNHENRNNNYERRGRLLTDLNPGLRYRLKVRNLPQTWTYSSASNCVETDNGNDPNNYGEITCGDSVLQDGCSTDTGLAEYYLTEGGEVELDIVNCNNGCSEGVCVPAPDPAPVEEKVTITPYVSGFHSSLRVEAPITDGDVSFNFLYSRFDPFFNSTGAASDDRLATSGRNFLNFIEKDEFGSDHHSYFVASHRNNTNPESYLLRASVSGDGTRGSERVYVQKNVDGSWVNVDGCMDKEEFDRCYIGNVALIINRLGYTPGGLEFANFSAEVSSTVFDRLYTKSGLTMYLPVQNFSGRTEYRIGFQDRDDSGNAGRGHYFAPLAGFTEDVLPFPGFNSERQIEIKAVENAGDPVSENGIDTYTITRNRGIKIFHYREPAQDYVEIFTPISSANEETNQNTCRDSDNGVNALEYGQIFLNGDTNSVVRDACNVVGTRLTEYYCNEDGSYSSEVIVCADRCSGGRCVTSTVRGGV